MYTSIQNSKKEVIQDNLNKIKIIGAIPLIYN